MGRGETPLPARSLSLSLYLHNINKYIYIYIYTYIYRYIYTYIHKYINTFFSTRSRQRRRGNGRTKLTHVHNWQGLANFQRSPPHRQTILIDKRHISCTSDLRRLASQFPSKSRYTFNLKTLSFSGGRKALHIHVHKQFAVLSLGQVHLCCQLYTVQGQQLSNWKANSRLADSGIQRQLQSVLYPRWDPLRCNVALGASGVQDLQEPSCRHSGPDVPAFCKNKVAIR